MRARASRPDRAEACRGAGVPELIRVSARTARAGARDVGGEGGRMGVDRVGGEGGGGERVWEAAVGPLGGAVLVIGAQVVGAGVDLGRYSGHHASTGAMNTPFASNSRALNIGLGR